MMKKTLLMVAVIAMAFAITPSASAILGTATANFDNLAHNKKVGATYSSPLTGVTMDGATTLCRPFYNYQYYPPTSGDCIAYTPAANGRLTLNFDGLVTKFEGDFMGYYATLTMNAYDVTGVGLVKTDKSCVTNFGSAIHCSWTFSSPVRKITINDAGNYWGFDTLVWENI